MHLVHNMTVLTREILHSLIVFKPQLEIGALPYLFLLSKILKGQKNNFTITIIIVLSGSFSVLSDLNQFGQYGCG